jgi:DNA-directed RNA polymerase subunit K/omega
MRSEYVFAASKEIGNRFMLCRVTSVSARRLQVGSRQASETINKSLKLIAAAELTQDNMAQDGAAPAETAPGAETQAAATAPDGVIPEGQPEQIG